MPAVSTTTTDWKEKAIRAGVKRLLYRLPNGRMYYQVIDGLIDHVKRNPDQVKRVADDARKIAVKVKDELTGETRAQQATLEGLLALVDERPEAGDVVVITADIDADTLAMRGSYGVVTEVNPALQTAGIDFYHLEGWPSEEDAHIMYHNIPLDKCKKAILLERQKRKEVMWPQPRTCAPSPVAQNTRERCLKQGLFSGAYAHIVRGGKELLRIHKDHAIYIVSTALLMWVFDCGPFNNHKDNTVSSQIDHTARQCSTFPPTLSTGIYSAEGSARLAGEATGIEREEKSLADVLLGR